MKKLFVFIVVAAVLLGALAWISSSVLPTGQVVVVDEVNFPPVIADIPDIHVSSNQGRMIDLKKYIDDENKGDLQVSVSESSDVNLLVLSDGFLVIDPLQDFVGETMFVVRVTDGQYEVVSEPVQVIVG